MRFKILCLTGNVSVKSRTDIFYNIFVYFSSVYINNIFQLYKT